MSGAFVGKVFGRLVVVNAPGRNKDGRRLYNCICECGTITSVSERCLLKGSTKSCGCLRRENTGQLNKSHGDTGKPEYNIWKAMKQRCDNPNDAAFANYGGRGISYEARWIFYEYFIVDMGYRESSYYTLERVDNDKGYSKENCIWAMRDKQSLNRRNTVKVLYKGDSVYVKDLASLWGISYSGAIKRIKKSCSKIDDTYIGDFSYE